MKITDTAGNDMMVAAAVAQETIKADIVTQTLDALNQGNGAGSSKSGSKSDMSSSYDFQKSVLSAAYGVTGVVTDIKS